MTPGRHRGLGVAALATRTLTLALLALAMTAAELPSLAEEDGAPSLDLRHRLIAGAEIEGNPRGTIDVIEFFDYRCPYCRQMHGTLDRLLAQDDRVRLVLKEWPIFGGVSVYAAKVAIAAGWQGKFSAIHAALWAIHPPMDRASVRTAARITGVDLDRLDRDMAERDAEIRAVLTQNQAAANELRLPGTPGLVVGSLVIRGGLSLSDLTSVIADAAREARVPRP